MREKRDLIRVKDFDVQIIRTTRKRTASLILEYGQLQLIVPESFPEEDMPKVVAKKHDWILKKASEQKIYPPFKIKEYVNGENFPFLGKNYRLKINIANHTSVDLQNGYIIVNLPKNAKDKAECAKQLLLSWYLKQAKVKLPEKVERFSKITGGIPKSIDVKDHKTKWGSCNKDGNLFFNWRIILAPHRIVDYIVMHELCHVLHHNHSKEFWHSLECHMPDYLERKEWLRVNGYMLNI